MAPDPRRPRAVLTRAAIDLARSDLYRYEADTSRREITRALRHPGARFTVALRLAHGLPRWSPLRLLAVLLYRRWVVRYGFQIPHRTSIGRGFYLGHFGGVVVSVHATIGENCNLSHQVTIARANRGPKQGAPVIGDRVYVGPGAKVIGKIVVGNDVAIGANAVVVDDVPAGAVVGGVPARVISQTGSAGYVNRVR